ncbi:hypothetical protein VOLCADRAFT_100329 [Volvox carteri f. nagariensis]|uniref:Uncharacterized protein n=1 Tax=Volvox carteri f. nagariensis TaxID=3068 RepID=D8UK06_VOLCA|nr:uncharacterized protein VOLCADRAFT_100329 [Volvox carteri f. nagariensis]EFJ39942.1 hypothetical protein VOLCADRAFT_100329 [Volvox carteri f. nagariensis]|eukprot:XP_002958994.1 hypothetical protein VOLCADRAFT_100329 [Volvox carteri f. nagariensis]
MDAAGSKRGHCENPGCYIHGKKRKLCRKVCSIPDCNQFLCDNADCHKVHAHVSHPDKLGEVKAVTRAEKSSIEVPEIFEAYRGHQKCSVCHTQRSTRRCKLCQALTCNDCESGHLHFCSFKLECELFDGSSEYGLCVLSDGSELRSADYHNLIKTLALDPSPPCHTVESAAKGHIHVAVPQLEVAMQNITGHPIKILALASTGTDANNLLWDVANLQASHLSGAHQKGYMMLQDGGYGEARGPIAALSSRLFVHDGRANAQDPDILALRPLLVCPLPLGWSYMSEVGELSRRKIEGIHLFSSSCEAMVSTRSKAIIAEAKSAPPAAKEDAKAAATYVRQVATALHQQSDSSTLIPAPLTETEEAAITVVSSRMHQVHVGVILIETFTSNDLMGYTYGFLLALRHLTAAKGVILAIDDIMMALHTGHIFSYLHYPAFFPDLITFGKGLQACGVAQVFPPPDAPAYIQHSSRSTALMGLDLSRLGGRVTNGGVDRITLERAIAILEEFMARDLKGNSISLGSTFIDEACSLFARKGVQRYLRSMAGIWASDAAFGGVLRQNLLHVRVIMRLDMHTDLLKEVFTAVGKHTNPEAQEGRGAHCQLSTAVTPPLDTVLFGCQLKAGVTALCSEV